MPAPRLRISGTNGTDGFHTDYNRSSTGIVWRRRLCDKGEFVAATNYCEECPYQQFSTTGAWHERQKCDAASDAAYAPGGAVLVPQSGGAVGWC